MSAVRAALMAGLVAVLHLAAGTAGITVGRLPGVDWLILAALVAALVTMARHPLLVGGLPRRGDRVAALLLGLLPLLLPALLTLMAFAGLAANHDIVMFVLQWTTAGWLPVILLAPETHWGCRAAYLWFTAGLPVLLAVGACALVWRPAKPPPPPS